MTIKAANAIAKSLKKSLENDGYYVELDHQSWLENDKIKRAVVVTTFIDYKESK